MALLGACATPTKQPVLQHENFEATTIHSRAFAASTTQTCEAARRALLSQGYNIESTPAELINGRKNFQPNSDVHVEINFRVVCAREGQGAVSTIAFANALQDRYTLKKVNNSASLGVGAFGSLSVPFSSSDEAMVKVASETLADAALYSNFFRLVQRYLEDAVLANERMPASVAPAAAPIPTPALASSPLPSSLPASAPGAQRTAGQ